MEKKTFTIFSTDTLVAAIRLLRDTRIRELLQNEQHLSDFLEKHCDVIAISQVRKDFLKKDLLALSLAPLNQVHYFQLIKEGKESGTIRTDLMNDLFILEFQLLFDSYKF